MSTGTGGLRGQGPPGAFPVLRMPAHVIAAASSRVMGCFADSLVMVSDSGKIPSFRAALKEAADHVGPDDDLPVTRGRGFVLQLETVKVDTSIFTY
jgi:hypothetical protein